MNQKYEVAVLMSTFNGEKYLVEQIESILHQVDVNVHLYIRDDGSKDSTLSILKSYGDKVTIIPSSENCGVGISFMKLVYYVKNDYDYYCFADQDDIWDDKKISVAINELIQCERRVLYVSNQKLVDSYGNFKRMRYIEDVLPDYKQILCNNLYSGCTMVWNKKLQGYLIDKYRRPSEELLRKRIHDVWVGMVAIVCGEIYYDNRSFINYRQHENNVVGVKTGSRFKSYIKKIKNPILRNGRSNLAFEIGSKFQDMLNEEMKVFLDYCGKYRESHILRKQLKKDKSISEYTGESRFQFLTKVFLNLF